MEKGFKYGGASELNFVNVLGLEGEYQNHSRVYGKKGEKCPNCHSTLRDKPSGSDSMSSRGGRALIPPLPPEVDMCRGG